jgi:hypothetical protein
MEDNKSFVPSSMFDKKFRKDLIKAFMEIQGKESTDEATKSLNANWSLVHENSERSPGPSRFLEFAKNISGKKGLMFMCKGKI